MANIRYKVEGGLSTNQLEMLNGRAMTILGTMGMEVNHAPSKEFLRGKAGFAIDGNRVRISRALLDECVEAARGKTYAGGTFESQEENWGVGILSGYPLHLADWRTNSVHPFREQDVRDMAKLVDALHDRMVSGSAPGMPQDLPTEIQAVRCFRIGAENCRAGGSVPVDSARTAEWIYRLMEVTGQRFGLGLYVVNPLKIDGDTIEQLYLMRDKPMDIHVGCMPMMGVSAPIHVMGAFALALASVWGGYAIARELTGRDDILFTSRIWPVNMKNLAIVYGGPEMVWSELVFKQIREFYHWYGPETDAYHSSAPFHDGQAAAQRGAYGMAAALAGKRQFQFGGMLGVDLVFSPVQLLLDIEMVRYFKHVTDGFEFSEDAFCMDAIMEVGPTGSFLGHPTTLLNHHKVLWDSHLWTTDSVGTWQAGGAPTFLDRAAQEIEELIKKHDYHLPDDKARELDQLCQKAEAALLGKK